MGLRLAAVAAVAAVLVLVHVPAPCSGASIDPRHATNLTLYHVNGRNYSATPRNMNTADIDGDMYFDLRSRGLPLECGPWINMSFWSRFDCGDAEVNVDPSTLAITKLVLEVDDRWGDYADCNVDHTGVYSCDCEGVPDNCTLFHTEEPCDEANSCMWDHSDGRCEVFGCTNITDRLDCVQGYHKCEWHAATSAGTCRPPPGPAPVCNHSLVGKLNLSQQDWGRHAHRGHKQTPVDYWHGNTLAKTDGFWFSTFAEGECRPGDESQTFCSWRLASVVRKVAKTCSDNAIDGVIQKGDASAPWGARCFEACPAAQRYNTSSECYIECFYKNVLGPKGTTQLMNHSSPDFGIPLAELRAAWDKPFGPVADGGCPPLP